LKTFHGKIENALEKVNQLNGYYFTENELAKELGYNNSSMQVGVSAQEVESVLPEIVKEAPINAIIDEASDYKTVMYEKMIPLLIEAIKELSEQNKQMASEIKKLQYGLNS
jgi:DNA-directed RNA polymerase specialized sigma subunit